MGWEDIAGALDPHVQGAVPQGGDARAAVALVLREGTAGVEALFIRRAEHPEDPWSGHMAFPGGRAEPGDRDLRDTAVRETLEETAVDLARDGELLGRLEETRAMARLRPVDLVITPFVFRVPEHVVAHPSHEVRSVHWIPLDVLFDRATLSTMHYEHGGARLRFPCYRVGSGEDPIVIWGLTFRMCSGLRDRMGRRGAAPDAR